ncbi:aldo/keto reductase [Desulfofarcimen acetoxidans DSM 771]|uniref:Aldo/keto reductase n=1 Tax=Desulfofarcimen acetoxidans (strain ATCC 49208 / DSM 771 / KCTC 5769 / VKM B-1644 / 5575) TaxID=485916 RepID=C8VZX7_DESAS|nr:aldo/keto reductase [Desulfofarcimen acetoxidans]ACV63105.1 aldo/keto reductase [Desulfofarcimen acetoxidans DSM 771]
MKYRVLGKTGLNVSVIGFGGIPIQRVTEKEATLIINRALDLGINFIDTARGYTDSEAKLGVALKNRRQQVYIATKSMDRTAEGITIDINKSLQTLGVDYIDLYQLHNVKDKAALEQVLSAQGALGALKKAKAQGLIKHIGITGHILPILLEALATEEIETVQFPFNAVEAKEAEALLNLAVKTNTGIIIMKPLAGGALQNPELALRFILEYPLSTVIPGMDKVEQVDQNVLAAHNFLPLLPAEKRILEEEAKKLGQAFCRRCEYCQPCRQGIEIPMVFLLDTYYTRYNLQGWAKERYRGLKTSAAACIQCGECEEKCPYNLPIKEMLSEAAGRLGQI